MKLRYVEVDPQAVAELSHWSTGELQRASDEALEDLGIGRRPEESYLKAWSRAMLAENGYEDTQENRERLVVQIKGNPDAMLFVWALGTQERQAFGLTDSHGVAEWYDAETHAKLLESLAQAGQKAAKKVDVMCVVYFLLASAGANWGLYFWLHDGERMGLVTALLAASFAVGFFRFEILPPLLQRFRTRRRLDSSTKLLRRPNKSQPT